MRGRPRVNGLALLALRYAAHHPGRSIVLTACIAVTLFLPAAATSLMQRYDEDLRRRADATPLLVGARGNRFDLTLAALYFRPAELATIPWSEFERLAASGRGLCIPLHVGATARGRPLVATTAEYAELRGSVLAAGSEPLRIGEATLGSEVARELGLGVGDVLYTDQVESYDIARPAALRLRVAGVYAPHGRADPTPDDGAVFVDVKTAWAVLGLAHGHAAEEDIPDELVVSRTERSLQVSGALIEEAALDEADVTEFHVHGGPETLPLSAVVVVPHGAKDATLLKSEVNASREWQCVAPRDVVDDLLGAVFRVKQLVDGVGAVLALSTALLVALVLALSSRLRAGEMRTLERIGAPRSTALALYGLELGAVVLAAALAAAVALAATLAFLPDLVTML